MIIGAHAIVYSADADADRAFFKELGLSHLDVGGGWLIFALPPAEVAFHPAKKPSHALYLMTDDVAAFVASMKRRKIACTPLADQGWGVLTELTLPSGGKLGVHEPRHARPQASTSSGRSARKPGAKRGPARPAKKTKAKANPKKTAKTPPARAKKKSAKRR
jgi:hypothetical protein